MIPPLLSPLSFHHLSPSYLALIIFLIASLAHHSLALTKAQLPFRHEFKHSIRRPFFLDLPHSPSRASVKFIPYHLYGGSAGPGPADFSLRLVPSVPLARGVVVSELPLRGSTDNITALAPGMAKGWDIQIKFILNPSNFALQAATSGKLNGKVSPGVGLALWITSTPLPKDPSQTFDKNDPMFGVNAISFDGVRIAIQPTPSKENPGHVRISGLVVFSMAQINAELGSCELDMRSNKAPTAISVEYNDESSKFIVWVDKTGTKYGWTHCFSKMVDLPQRGGYLALSAANGDLEHTDDVDVMAMDVFALEPVVQSHPKLADKLKEMNKDNDKILRGISSISYSADGKVLHHAREIEQKVHKIMDENDQQRIREAKEKDTTTSQTNNNPDSAPKIGNNNFQNNQVPASNLANLEASIASLSSQIQSVAANVATLKGMLSSQNTAPAGNTPGTSKESDTGTSTWRATIKANIDHLTSLISTNHKELLDLIHNVRGTGESAHAAASLAHDAATSAARAATEAQAKPSGHSWMTLFLLMLGAQCVGMIMITIWRTIRGDKQPKKYL